MQILFTTRDHWASKLIRDVLDEPTSHCVIKIGRFVVHADFFHGVYVMPWVHFLAKNKVLYAVDVGMMPGKIDRLLYDSYKKPYDYIGFLWLGLRRLLPKKWTNKQDIKQVTGAFMCHELVNSLLSQEEQTLLTPYKLYLKLLEAGYKPSTSLR